MWTKYIYSQRHIELSKYVARVFYGAKRTPDESVQWFCAEYGERIRCYSYSFHISLICKRLKWIFWRLTMGIFIRGLGIKQTCRRSNIMFSTERKFKRKKIAASRDNSSNSPAANQDNANVPSGAADAPNLYPLARPRHVIPKKTVKAKLLHLDQPTLTATDKHGSDDGGDLIADDTLFEAADDKLLLTNIQQSLSSIHLKQSDIESNLWRMMRTRCSDRKTPTFAMADGDTARQLPFGNDYINGMQQQTVDDCQCCYHDENHHYEYDSHQLHGKLVNFIVLIAIFLHYAIIAFIEPNYFDWFFILSSHRIDGVSLIDFGGTICECIFSWNQSICSTSSKLI